jgi:putative Ca2+/H+ antiporter (TMEM165/GDT1 family)
MEAFLVSSGVVAIAEIGDKTQLLALLLAARYRRPLPIILGILLATLGNHAAAAAFGSLVAAWVGGDWLRWGLGLSFLAMAAWVLVPDKADDDDGARMAKAGPFLATLMTFFLVEIGDKTQIATIALAARFHDLILVTAGTTAGMMLVNAPAVLMGDFAATKVPMGVVRGVAASTFAVLGVLALLDVGGTFAAIGV